jgi:hypothetical protein
VLTCRRDTNGFDSFADIASSTATLVKNALQGVDEAIEEVLNSKDIFAEGGVLNLFSPGTFAQEIPKLDDSVQNSAIAALASPSINKLYNEQRGVIIRVDSKLLKDLIDPCDGDKLFNRRNKFCTLGSAYIVRRFPREDEGDVQFDDPGSLGLPGIEQLEDFGLTFGQIAEASLRNQRAHGLFGTPKTTDLIGTVASATEDIDLTGSIFFNLPVCSLESFELGDTEAIQCRARFGDNVSFEWLPVEVGNTNLLQEAMCILHTMLVCGCRHITIGGQDWPYQPNNFQCNERNREDVDFRDNFPKPSPDAELGLIN